MKLNIKFSLLTPMNLSYWWNIGSLLGILLIIQIASGFMLSIFYEHTTYAFYSVWSLHLDIFFGEFMHVIHLHFVTWLFFFLYLHKLKGLIFSSFLHVKLVWISGWVIMLMMMGAAFMGYVLPWGQMSYWGAMVITSLFTLIPFVGKIVIDLMWGGYAVGLYTVKLFFSLHFILPLISLVFIFMHIFLLHYTGSSNPMGGSEALIKDEFMSSFLYKDLMNIMLVIIFVLFSVYFPYAFSDPENFFVADILNSPNHIQPEWYFLAYFGILRSVPNKLGGVIVFMVAVSMVMLMTNLNSFMSLNTFKIWYMLVMSYVAIFLYLTNCGPCSNPLEVYGAKIFACFYFIWFFVLMGFLKVLK